MKGFFCYLSICVNFDRAIIEVRFFIYLYEMLIIEWLVKIIVSWNSVIASSSLARIQTEFERDWEAKNLNRKMVICYSLAVWCYWVCWISVVLQCYILFIVVCLLFFFSFKIVKNFYEGILVGGSKSVFDIKCGSFISCSGFHLWARDVGLLYINEWWFIIK